MCLFCCRRALIPGTSIKSLDTDLKTLALKRTASFVKAAKELARHQELMQHASATTHEMEDNDNISGGDNDIDDDQVGVHHVGKVMEFRKTIFQAWKVMENNMGHGK